MDIGVHLALEKWLLWLLLLLERVLHPLLTIDGLPSWVWLSVRVIVQVGSLKLVHRPNSLILRNSSVQRVYGPSMVEAEIVAIWVLNLVSGLLWLSFFVFLAAMDT